MRSSDLVFLRVLFRGLLRGLAPDSRMAKFLLRWQQVSTMWVWQQALKHFLKWFPREPRPTPLKSQTVF